MVNWLNSWAHKKIVGGFKDKVVSLFKINTSKQTVQEGGHKISKEKAQEQSDENIIN